MPQNPKSPSGSAILIGLLFMAQYRLIPMTAAPPHLAAVVSGADAAGIQLQSDFGDIFGVDNDLNSEIIFSTQISSSIVDEYGFLLSDLPASNPALTFSQLSTLPCITFYTTRTL